MSQKPAISPTQLNLKYRFLEGFGITCFAIGIFLALSMLSYQPAKNTTQLITYAAQNMGGEAGYYLARWLFMSVGTMAYLLPPILGYMGVLSFKNRLLDWGSDYLLTLCQALGFALIVISGCGFNASFNFHKTAPYPGGLVGFYIEKNFNQFIGAMGIRLLLTVLLLTGVTLVTGVSWVNIVEQLGQLMLGLFQQFKHHSIKLMKKFFKAMSQPNGSPPSTKKGRLTPANIMNGFSVPDKSSVNSPTFESNPTLAATQLPQVQHLETGGKTSFSIKQSEASSKLPPSLELLDLPEKNNQFSYTPEELETLSREVELRLKEFAVQVEVVGVYPGPVVTRFEMQLAPGVKASRITTLAKDLARSLSVVSVRIVEIIPGKPVVGLELPNRHREMVRLREILSAEVYTKAPSPLSIALGKDIAGKPVVADLAKMPHLLVAGTTGSGKSVGLNAMLLSIVYKANPDQVRLIMIDPKMLELSIYEGIPHLLAPVVTDMKKAASALRWCIEEMERRYKLMSILGVRNLAGYNQKVEDAIHKGKPLINPIPQDIDPDATTPEILQPLPYILVLVDEFADLIMVVGKKVEELIARLAQKARAAGIHLILATQRPSVDVITGLIKANIPTRIAFQVSSRIDSRTILDQQGAEQLLGHGDMLYMAPGTGVPTRVHGAFVADHEVHNVVEALKQAGPPDYYIVFSEGTQEEGSQTESGQNEHETDPLYDKAVQIVIESRRASISNVQRRLKIGYNRAASLLEEMEKKGVVSSMETNGKREVLVPEHTS
jgi:S-DNA-T family DNA segregation ATPase FtsK/SpoIIIE